MKFYFLISLPLLIFISNEQKSALRPGKDYALFFAVNDYDSMRPLSNPIADAKDIAQELERTYNFATEVVENPTIEEIEAKLKLYANRFANNELDQNGQLFIYFSGHGVVDNQNGFFLAKDSDPDKLSRTGIAYEYWRPFINNISCKHILVAIDACFSGTFDPNWWSRSGRPGELSDSEKLITNHTNYTTRLFFTSAAETESPDQSNFARKLLEGLRSGGGADNILTSTELFAFLELANPKPHRGEFGKNEAGSSFLFIPSNPVEMVSDPTGRKYKTVKINGRTWLAENLAFDLEENCWCFGNNPESCKQYGRLYTWEAARLSCKVLGNGWRLPTDEEWRTLINNYGDYSDGFNITVCSKTVNNFPSKSKKYLEAYTALSENQGNSFKAVFAGYCKSIHSISGLFRIESNDMEKGGYYWSSSAYDGSVYKHKLSNTSLYDYDYIFFGRDMTFQGKVRNFEFEDSIVYPSDEFKKVIEQRELDSRLISYGPIAFAFMKDSKRVFRGLSKQDLGLSCRCIKE